MSKLQAYDHYWLDFDADKSDDGECYDRKVVDKLLKNILKTMEPKMDSLTKGADLIKEALGE